MRFPTAFALAALLCLPRLQATPIRDLQHELKLDDSGWKVTAESDTKINWVTPTGVRVELMMCREKDSEKGSGKGPEPDPRHIKQSRDIARQLALESHGGLVEIEPRKAGGIVFSLVTMKFPLGAFNKPPDDQQGFAFATSATIATSEGCYLLQAVAAERGTTGVREAAGLVIYMKEKGIGDVLEAGKSFHKDPYNHAFDKDALYVVSDERRFDEAFPNHPLSQCRKLIDSVLASWTIPDRIRKIALFQDKKASNQPSRPDTAGH